jgi:hypothetical protein
MWARQVPQASPRKQERSRQAAGSLSRAMRQRGVAAPHLGERNGHGVFADVAGQRLDHAVQELVRRCDGGGAKAEAALDGPRSMGRRTSTPGEQMCAPRPRPPPQPSTHTHKNIPTHCPPQKTSTLASLYGERWEVGGATLAPEQPLRMPLQGRAAEWRRQACSRPT